MGQYTETKLNKERVAFLDQLRVLATLGVVLLHTATGVLDIYDLTQYPGAEMVFVALRSLTVWCVPVFVVISGYLFLNPERDLSLWKMLWKYCRRIILALFVFGVPFALLEQVAVAGEVNAAMFPRAFWMVLTGKSWAHLWYLYMILALYLVTPLIRWVLRKTPGATVYGCMAVLFAGCSALPFIYHLLGITSAVQLPDWGIYLFYYLSGNALYRWRDVRAKWGLGEVVCGKLFLIVGAVLCTMKMGDAWLMTYFHPFTAIFTLLLVRGMSGIHLEVSDPMLWEKLGELCFGIYLVHPVFLNFFYKFLKITPLDFPLVLSIPSFYLMALLGATLVSWLLGKISILKKYVI